MSAPRPHDSGPTPRQAIVDVLFPVAVDTAYQYRVPAELALEPGRLRRRSARHAPRRRNRVGDARGRRRQPEAVLALSATRRRWKAAARLRRLGRPLDALAPRHGAAHGDPRAGDVRAASAAAWIGRDRKAAHRLTAAAPACSRRSRAKLSLRRSKSALAEAAGAPGVIDGLVDDGVLAQVDLPPETIGAGPTPASAAALSPIRRRRDDLAARVEQNLFRDPARRRHRLGQDRGLFRGGGGSAAAWPADADPAARDRADGAVPRPVRGALRRAAGGMAFGGRRRPARPGARSPRAEPAWWSARARLCSCRSPTSA